MEVSQSLGLMQIHIEALRKTNYSLENEALTNDIMKRRWRTISGLLFILLLLFGYSRYKYTQELRENNILIHNANKVLLLEVDMYKQTLENTAKARKYSREYQEQALIECITKSAMMK